MDKTGRFLDHFTWKQQMNQPFRTVAAIPWWTCHGPTPRPCPTASAMRHRCCGAGRCGAWKEKTELEEMGGSNLISQLNLQLIVILCIIMLYCCGYIIYIELLQTCFFFLLDLWVSWILEVFRPRNNASWSTEQPTARENGRGRSVLGTAQGVSMQDTREVRRRDRTGTCPEWQMLAVQKWKVESSKSENTKTKHKMWLNHMLNP